MTDPIAPPSPSTPPPAGAPTPETPPTNASPAPESGTPPGSSPEGEPPAPEQETPPEPTPEELAATARAAVHETPEPYVQGITLDDAGREALGLTDGDPLVAGLADYASKNGKPQAWVNDALEAAAEMAKAGLFDAGFDPAAEAAKLGENAAGRRTEVETWANAVKTRGEIDDGMFGELMSLSPTADGIRLIEWFRKSMRETGPIDPPKGDPVPAETEAQIEARKLSRDPRYGQDRTFTRDADKKWQAAFGGVL